WTARAPARRPRPPGAAVRSLRNRGAGDADARRPLPRGRPPRAGAEDRGGGDLVRPDSDQGGAPRQRGGRRCARVGGLPRHRARKEGSGANRPGGGAGPLDRTSILIRASKRSRLSSLRAMVESSPANAQGRLAKEKDGLLLVSTHVPDTAARIRSVALRHNLAVRALPRGGRIDEALAADEGAVLLMDLRFGGPHGAGSVAALRCDPRFAHAPVIALVGDKDDAAARDAVSAGANDFLRESMIERELPLKLLLVRRRMADA